MNAEDNPRSARFKKDRKLVNSPDKPSISSPRTFINTVLSMKENNNWNICNEKEITVFNSE